jgi:CheY-like chemotaxis protein
MENTSTQAHPVSTLSGSIPAHVLIVEDHLPQRIFLRELLKRAGVPEIVEVENGRQALQVLNKHPFDLLVVDLIMPEIDGLQLLGHLKEDHAAIPPVILCSVMAQEPLAACAAWLGMHYDLPVIGAIAKPLTAEAIFSLYAAYRASKPGRQPHH